MKKKSGIANLSKRAARPAIMLDEPSVPVRTAEAFAPPLAHETSAQALAPLPTEANIAPPLVEVVETVPLPIAAETVETIAPPVAEAAEPVTPTPAEAVEVAAPPPAVAPALQHEAQAVVEKSVDETRLRLVEAKSAANETAAAMEASFGAARDGVVALSVKAIEAVKAGADANFDLFASLASVKSVSELVTLQGEFARARFEDASQRAKELGELARKVADDTVAPIKAQVAKAFKI